MSDEDDTDPSRQRAQGYVDAAEYIRCAFPVPSLIATAPQELNRPLLLFCPGQGGWHTGEWREGEWTDALTRGKSLQPTHWMEAPPTVPDD
jgi:hypothetical protein